MMRGEKSPADKDWGVGGWLSSASKWAWLERRLMTFICLAQCLWKIAKGTTKSCALPSLSEKQTFLWLRGLQRLRGKSYFVKKLYSTNILCQSSLLPDNTAHNLYIYILFYFIFFIWAVILKKLQDASTGTSFSMCVRKPGSNPTFSTAAVCW